ncbi:MAG: M48 family metallopeptidase [Sedimentisphaerales bacterium]|nr:M48 family metallopeptidase [Sedimentisphaerales bacterium]
MNAKHVYPIVGSVGVLAAVLFSGCAEVADLGSQLAQDAGVISASQAESINRSAHAIDKAQEQLTPEQEYYIGRAVAAKVFQTYPPMDQPQVNSYLNLLGQSLAIFSNRPETYGGYHFLLLDSDEINAFAAPGGLILVTRGMVGCCTNEDELAAVLAHEICHVEMKHGLHAIKQGRLTEALMVVAEESARQLGNEELQSLTDDFVDSVGDVVMTLTTKGYSRMQEHDADAAAVQLLRRAGYPEGAMITMLQRMDQRLASARGLGFAKTHPSAKSRADLLKATLTDSRFIPDASRQERFSVAMRSMPTNR